jgi:hypothetical protein
MRCLRLQLELQRRPITGTVEYEDGSHDSFAGWLGLLSILENAPAEPPAAKPPSDSRQLSR